MVDWVNVYFAGKLIVTAIGIVLQLALIFIIWISGGFKK